jgi:hypothetical protein
MDIATFTVQVRPQTYRVLQELAKVHGEAVPDTLDRLVDEARRSLLFRQAAKAYETQAADPEADALWRAEIAAWDVKVGDGLEPEPEPEP